MSRKNGEHEDLDPIKIEDEDLNIIVGLPFEEDILLHKVRGSYEDNDYYGSFPATDIKLEQDIEEENLSDKDDFTETIEANLSVLNYCKEEVETYKSTQWDDSQNSAVSAKQKKDALKLVEVLNETPISYKCSKCGLKCRTQRMVEAHVRRVHFGDNLSSRRLLGSERESKFQPSLDLRKTYKLKRQQKNSTLKEEMTESILNMIVPCDDEEKIFKCKKCQRAFSCKYRVEFHIRRVHFGERPAKCLYCRKSFYHEYAKRNHEANCFKEGKVRQEVKKEKVDTSFKSKVLNSSILGICILTKSQIEKAKALICEVKSTKNSRSQFECTKCHRRYSRKDDGWKHVRRSHFGERKFACSKCGKGYCDKVNVKAHEFECLSSTPPLFKSEAINCSEYIAAQQSNIRAWTKYQEDKSLPTESKSGILSKNQERKAEKLIIKIPKEKSHVGRLVYKCTKCTRIFLSENSGARHARQVHFGERPYACRKCNKRFTEEKSRTAHQVTCETKDSGVLVQNNRDTDSESSSSGPNDTTEESRSMNILNIDEITPARGFHISKAVKSLDSPNRIIPSTYALRSRQHK